MKNIYIFIIFGCLAMNSTVSIAADGKCIFKSDEGRCEEFVECKGVVEKLLDHKADLSRLASSEDFLKLLENIREGNSCAQALGFKIFEVALNNSEAEFLEEFSIALSYSIEKNPIGFIREIPNKFLEKKEIIISLSCGVYEEYRENDKYIQRQLNRRLIQIETVEESNLTIKKKIIESSIKDHLNKFNRF